MPSRMGVTSARRFVRAPSVNMLFTSWLAMLQMPRGRWYLKLRPVARTPAAQRALVRVSPAYPEISRPSKRNVTCFERSIHSPGRGPSRSILLLLLAAVEIRPDELVLQRVALGDEPRPAGQVGPPLFLD